MANKPIRTDEFQGEILHEYDGIEEADNRLPQWWLMTFYGAIFFAVAYWFAFHLFGLADNPGKAYVQAKLAAMDKGGPVTDEDLVALAADPSMVSAGGEAYAKHCVSCHAGNGSGNIGPNLTDEFWLHGGAPGQIYTTIAKGIDGKGMQAWKPALGGGVVKQLTVFVMSKQGSNVAGKAPQGERYVPAAPGAAPAAPGEPAAPAAPTGPAAITAPTGPAATTTPTGPAATTAPPAGRGASPTEG